MAIAIKVPGSKSITNRALLSAALAKGTSRIENALMSDDSKLMMKALKNLGIKMKKQKDFIKVRGDALKKPKNKIFCGNAGTVMRFLTAALALQPFQSTIDGDERMRQRPIADLVNALISLGAEVRYLKQNGFPPIKIEKPFIGGKCKVKGNVSSQFISGLLIAAPLAPKNTVIEVLGDLVSKPYVDLTLQIMKKFGISVKRNGYKKFFIKGGQTYEPCNIKIEGDASSASYFWGIGALAGEKIEIANIPKNSLQADTELIRILEKHFPQPSTLPARRSLGEGGNPPLSTIHCSYFPDGALTLAVLCAFNKGKFVLTGLSNLRIKECDRLRALATELRKIGAGVKELRDGLEIIGYPERLRGADIKTYKDHRIAMCFGMAGAVLPGIKIENPGCASKTYPNFWNDLARVKKYLRRKNVILNGMRGSGKTKLGKTLAMSTKRHFIDIDALIARTAKMKINEIVEKRGWKYFRELEQKAVKVLKNAENSVIAAGGGTLMNPTNAKILKKNGKVVFLECPIPILKKRLIKSHERPSLIQKRAQKKNFIEELQAVYRKRKKQYYKTADAVIDASNNSRNKTRDFDKKIKEILKYMERWGMV